jgi:hypothetical protein
VIEAAALLPARKIRLLWVVGYLVNDKGKGESPAEDDESCWCRGQCVWSYAKWRMVST